MKKIQPSNKKLNIQNLLEYGFLEECGVYKLRRDIADGQLELIVSVDRDETVITEVFDKEDGGEYTLHLVESAAGAFVGQVRQEYEDVLAEIFERCFDSTLYKAAVLELFEYIADKYSSVPEFLWDDENCIVRHSDNLKWYGAFLKVKASKLGIDSGEIIEVLNLKVSPEDMEGLIDMKRIFPAYHMNKKHWISVFLAAFEALDDVKRLIDKSFHLTENKRK